MEDFKEFEKFAWEEKAARYDDTWGTVTNQVIEAVLEEANIRPGMTLLDCGCGPGHLCEAASRLGAIPLGTDYSESMVKIAAANYSNLRFTKEDAETLSFSDNSFDAVILNYLLLHVSDQKKVVREATRVLKPGGRLVYAIWLPPADSPGLKIIFDAIMKFADTTVIPPAQDIFLYADRDRAKIVLEEHGLIDVRTTTFKTCWRAKSPEAFFGAVQAGTRIGGLIERQTAWRKEQIRGSIFASLEEFRGDDGYRISTPSLIASGRKVGE